MGPVRGIVGGIILSSSFDATIGIRASPASPTAHKSKSIPLQGWTSAPGSGLRSMVGSCRHGASPWDSRWHYSVILI